MRLSVFLLLSFGVEGTGYHHDNGRQSTFFTHIVSSIVDVDIKGASRLGRRLPPTIAATATTTTTRTTSTSSTWRNKGRRSPHSSDGSASPPESPLHDADHTSDLDEFMESDNEDAGVALDLARNSRRDRHYYGDISQHDSVDTAAANLQASIAALQAGQLSLGQMLAMSATQNPSDLLQNPLAAATAAGLPGLSGLSFSAQEVQAMQQNFQQQAIQQLAMLQTGSSRLTVSGPQAQFYLAESHVQQALVQAAQQYQQNYRNNNSSTTTRTTTQTTATSKATTTQQKEQATTTHNNLNSNNSISPRHHPSNPAPAEAGDSNYHKKLLPRTALGRRPILLNFGSIGCRTWKWNGQQCSYNWHTKPAATPLYDLPPEETTDLEELEQFAKTFKQRRIKLGFTQGDCRLGHGQTWLEVADSALLVEVVTAVELVVVLEELGWPSNIASGKSVVGVPLSSPLGGGGGSSVSDGLGRRRKKRTSIETSVRVALEKAFFSKS
uniref:POU-specific domain-containing protein n=1 Tax=Daphnia galeata TaxID=27404 RepID=A0A8J2RCS0_9CRUS|nr:unnamed protein product [Daphnia galeata]